MLFTDKYQSIQDQGIPTLKTYAGESIVEYLEDKKKKSVQTYNAYLSDYSNFFVDVFDLSIDHITVGHLEAIDYELLKKYRDNLYNELKPNGARKYKNTTINRKISSIRKLLKHLNGRQIISTNINSLDEIEKLPDDGEEIEYISVEHSLMIADWVRINSKHNGYEKYLYVLFAIETGLRVNEILSLEWNNFKEIGNKIILKGKGKGKKDFLDVIDKDLYSELLTIKKEDNNKVFSLKYHNVNDMMKQATKGLGIEKDYSSHGFKKTAVTYVYRKTGSLQAAQQKGRHKSMNTTVKTYIAPLLVEATGVISGMKDISENLYKEVPHEILIRAIGNLGGDLKILLNGEIKELLD